MRSTRVLATLILFIMAGMEGICYATPPKPSSLRDAWLSAGGKCGVLVEKNGVYEFAFDSDRPREGKHCVTWVGADLVVFAPAGAENRKQYVVVPVERAILRILQ